VLLPIRTALISISRSHNRAPRTFTEGLLFRRRGRGARGQRPRILNQGFSPVDRPARSEDDAPPPPQDEGGRCARLRLAMIHKSRIRQAVLDASCPPSGDARHSSAR
jgi:hypothetical protein